MKPGIEGAAEALWQARSERKTIARVSETFDIQTVQDAYAIQMHNVRRRVAAGAVVRGRRMGRTSRPRQHVLGVDEPDFGVLLDDMAYSDGDTMICVSLCARTSSSTLRRPVKVTRSSSASSCTIRGAISAVALSTNVIWKATPRSRSIAAASSK